MLCWLRAEDYLQTGVVVTDPSPENILAEIM